MIRYDKYFLSLFEGELRIKSKILQVSELWPHLAKLIIDKLAVWCHIKWWLLATFALYNLWMINRYGFNYYNRNSYLENSLNWNINLKSRNYKIVKKSA